MSTCIVQRWKKKKGWGAPISAKHQKGVVWWWQDATAAATINSSSVPIGLSRSMLPSPTKSWRRERREGEEKDERETRKVTRDPARYAICSCNAPPSSRWEKAEADRGGEVGRSCQVTCLPDTDIARQSRKINGEDIMQGSADRTE